MFCSHCGTENNDNASFCSNCGRPLDAATRAADVDNQAGAQEADLRSYYEAAIGPKNTDFYLTRFERFDSGGSSVSWNWPAFFVTLYWLLYRKMWGWAFLYFALSFVYGIVTELYLAASPTTEVVANLAFLVFSCTVIPMYANALYHRRIKDKIQQSEHAADNESKRLQWLASKGGTSSVVIIVLVILIPVLIGIMAAIALPAYQDYTVRSKMSEPLAALSYAKTGIAEHVAAYGRYPSDFNALDIGLGPRPDSNIIASLQVGNVLSGDTVRVVANVHSCLWEGGVCSDTAFASFHLAGVMNADGTMNWSCHPGDENGNNAIELKYLPANCRGR